MAAMGLLREGASPLLARILASRGVPSLGALSGGLKNLHHHSLLKGAQEAAVFLANRIEAKKRLLIIADYDCDGATACAVALRGLRAFGATVGYVVPDRMVHGYGLTPSVVELALTRFPDTEVLITVDNGVASHAGVAAAKAAGLEVLVTDHHLPSKTLPLPGADVIVDPAQLGCSFPSKALAGVGVIWYVLWALQDELRRRGVAPEMKVSQLLPLVAVGTVADVVPLDENNRILVQAGLDRIRAGEAFPGIKELATVGPANRTEVAELLTSHIAFGIGPRINAAGRLETMDIGIECLITDNPERAAELAKELDSINQSRKEIEHGTVIEAVRQAEAQVEEGTSSIAVFSPEWHAGVVGIVAGRIKERRYRPTFVLTEDPKTKELKGSGRSIPGFNLKDALDQVDKAVPGLLLKFGGHAMAAGVTLKPGGFEKFKEAFEVQAKLGLTAELLNQTLEHDGSLSGPELCVKTVSDIMVPPWGQMFLEPSFCDSFTVLEAKLTGPHKDQLNLRLEKEGVQLSAVKFRHEGATPCEGGMLRAIYKISKTRNKYGAYETKLLLDFILN